MTIASGKCILFPAADQATTRSAPKSPAALNNSPGIAVAGAIAAFAFLLRHFHGLTAFSPMTLAIVILFIVAISLIVTFAFTVWMGRALGVARKLAELTAAGTSICGASAIIATNAIADAEDGDIAYAIACVTIFGSVAMFAYPLLSRLLHLDPQAYGLWSGASIHEIAQLVAASFQNSQRAGETATRVKLARVMLLAPVVFALNAKSRFLARSVSERLVRPPVPWFVIGFVAVVGIDSLVYIPVEAGNAITALTTVPLTVALAAWASRPMSQGSARKVSARLCRVDLAFLINRGLQLHPDQAHGMIRS